MKESEYVDSLTDVGETVFGLQGLTTIYISSNDEAHFRESLAESFAVAKAPLRADAGVTAGAWCSSARRTLASIPTATP